MDNIKNNLEKEGVNVSVAAKTAAALYVGFKYLTDIILFICFLPVAYYYIKSRETYNLEFERKNNVVCGNGDTIDKWINVDGEQFLQKVQIETFDCNSLSVFIDFNVWFFSNLIGM